MSSKKIIPLPPRRPQVDSPPKPAMPANQVTAIPVHVGDIVAPAVHAPLPAVPAAVLLARQRETAVLSTSSASSEDDDDDGDDDAPLHEAGSRPLPPPPQFDAFSVFLRRPSRQIISLLRAQQEARRTSKDLLCAALSALDAPQTAFGPDQITEALDWKEWRRGSHFDVDAPGQDELLQWELLAPALLMGASGDRQRRAEPFPHSRRDQAAAVLQRTLRGFVVRRLAYSYKWTRAKLRMSIASRSVGAVEDALAASRAIGAVFLRPPEHQLALVALDMIREEAALRPRLEELAAQSGEKDGQAVVRRFSSVVDRVLRCRSMDEHAFRDATAVKALRVFEGARARKSTFHMLRRAVGSRKPDELMRALHESEAMAKQYMGEWEPGFLAAERNAARALLVQMQHEEPALTRLRAALASGDAEEVKLAAVELDACAPHATAGASTLVALSATLRALDEAVAAAQAGKATWTACEVALGRARSEHARWAKEAGLPSLSQQQQQQQAADGRETAVDGVRARIEVVAEKLDRRAGVFDVLHDVALGVRQCDVDGLVRALARADALKLDRRAVHDEHLAALFADARACVERHAGVHAALVRALEGKDRAPAKLAEASALARALPVADGSVDDLLALRCEALCGEAKRLAHAIERAVEHVGTRDELVALMAEVRDTWGLGGMPEAGELRKVLELPEDKFIHEQLRALEKSGIADPARRAALLVRLRELFLKANSAKAFKPENFVDLRPPAEWAAAGRRRRLQFVGRKKGHDMLAWSAQPLVGRPLTKTARDVESVGKLSGEASQAIARCMGDWSDGQNPVDALHGVLVGAFQNKDARDEVYLMLIKQLSKNAGAASVRVGWLLMGIFLDSFAPSPAFDVHLEVFIRAEAPVDKKPALLAKLHSAVFATSRVTGVVSKADVVRLVG